MLPALPGVDYDRSSLLLSIQNDEHLETKIYFKRQADEDYSEENIIKRDINAGLNQLIFDLSGIANESRVRIDPGHIPGGYSIKEIEIRSE